MSKKVIGLMKDKLGGRIITEFVALRLKLYAYETLGGRGDKKCIIKKTLDFEDYMQCLLAGQDAFRKQLFFGTSYTKSIPLR